MPARAMIGEAVERPALRRLMLLLHRLHDDTGGADRDVDALLNSACALASGGTGRPALVEQFEVSIEQMRSARVPGAAATEQLLRENVVSEAYDLAQKLKSRPETSAPTKVTRRTGTSSPATSPFLSQRRGSADCRTPV